MTGFTASSFSVPPVHQKPIRFVNNEGRPPSKRRRINAACQTCRRRKIRCDGKQPICDTCTENGYKCLGYSPSGNSASKGKPKLEDGVSEEEDGADSTSMRASTSSESAGHNTIPRVSKSLIPQSTEATTSQDPSLRANLNGPPTFSDEAPGGQPASENRRVPYFRYFGPTAIVPGYKQMVVSVKDHRRSSVTLSGLTGASPQSVNGFEGDSHHNYSTASQTSSEARVVPDIPTYDPTDDSPLSPLIKHLVEIFFVHLGSNFPFLQKDRFMKLVVDKQADSILVDAICSLSARFSDHPLFSTSHKPRHGKPNYGNVYAQRARSAVIDTFPCPTVAATQACLLLAYESFGAGQDSALWMYLGCAIRMAVDLGLQKFDGVKGQESQAQFRAQAVVSQSAEKPSSSPLQRGAEEKERTDTLWAVFMLDRVISSGTGRPVTLKDDDFELPFPEVTNNAETGWPAPFPALIRIIHLYGRVSDLLNNIRNVKDLTESKMQVLAGMENDLTKLYQKLDQRLTFNAANFQHYVKSGEGTNFILVHFWFHTLIMLVHQPMLLHSFEGRIQQLLPNSRELSMSSAKTVADILAFAELIDPKSFIGNPFTSQPMYIAACAFLMESAAHTSQPPSRDASPPGRNKQSKKDEAEANHSAKHSLLAIAANQNYQRCFRALQQLETYWAGTKYIITALEQKAKGIWDPETYTSEEMESTKAERHDVPNDWKRKMRYTLTTKSPRSKGMGMAKTDHGESAIIDPTQAIGWSLTGTTNSPSSNLAFLYQCMNGGDPQPTTPSSLPGNMIYDPIRQSIPESLSPGMASAQPATMSYLQSHDRVTRPEYMDNVAYRGPMPPPGLPIQSSSSLSDADLLLGLQQHSPFPNNSSIPSNPFGHSPSSVAAIQPSRPSLSSHSSGGHLQHKNQVNGTSQGQPSATPYDFSTSNMAMGGFVFDHNRQSFGLGGVGDMMIETQEIDMTTLGNDMMPWLEYLPSDVYGMDSSGHNKGGWPQ